MPRRTWVFLALTACHRQPSAPPQEAPSVDAAAVASGARAVDVSLLSASPATQSEIEPTLVVTRNGAIGAAWMGVRAGRAHGDRLPFLARPGGDLGGRPSRSHSPDDRAGADPVLAADPPGNVYLAWLGTGVAGPNGSDRLPPLRRPRGGGLRRLRRSDRPDRQAAAGDQGRAPVARRHRDRRGHGHLGLHEPVRRRHRDRRRAADGRKWVEGVVIERIDLRAGAPVRVRVVRTAIGSG